MEKSEDQQIIKGFKGLTNVKKNKNLEEVVNIRIWDIRIETDDETKDQEMEKKIKRLTKEPRIKRTYKGATN